MSYEYNRCKKVSTTYLFLPLVKHSYRGSLHLKSNLLIQTKTKFFQVASSISIASFFSRYHHSLEAVKTARKALRMPLVTLLILEVLLEAYWGLENKSSRKHKAFLDFSWNFVCHIGLHDEPTVQELEVLCQNYIYFVYGNTLGSQCYRKR